MTMDDVKQSIEDTYRLNRLPIESINHKDVSDGELSTIAVFEANVVFKDEKSQLLNRMKLLKLEELVEELKNNTIYDGKRDMLLLSSLGMTNNSY